MIFVLHTTVQVSIQLAAHNLCHSPFVNNHCAIITNVKSQSTLR